jgi:hypothetical protein
VLGADEAVPATELVVVSRLLVVAADVVVVAPDVVVVAPDVVVAPHVVVVPPVVVAEASCETLTPASTNMATASSQTGLRLMAFFSCLPICLYPLLLYAAALHRAPPANQATTASGGAAQGRQRRGLALAGWSPASTLLLSDLQKLERGRTAGLGENTAAALDRGPPQETAGQRPR